MFFSLCNQDPKEVYQELQQTLNYRIIKKSMIYVGWNQPLIQRGNYFYAFSHIPLHKLSIQNNTFTITCFRDPIQRIISHYTMLMEYKVNGIYNNDMAVEGHYLGNTFLDFINQLPPEKLLNQLFMFSKHFDIDEALGQISNLDHYFFSEYFEDGIHELNSKINLNLKPLHIRKSNYKENIPPSSIDHLREMLDKEYRLISAIKSI